MDLVLGRQAHLSRLRFRQLLRQHLATAALDHHAVAQAHRRVRRKDDDVAFRNTGNMLSPVIAKRVCVDIAKVGKMSVSHPDATG